MEWKEYKAKTVSDAITDALIDLSTTSDNIEYEVIEEGTTRLLGLFSKDAVVRVRKKKEENPEFDENPAIDLKVSLGDMNPIKGTADKNSKEGRSSSDKRNKEDKIITEKDSRENKNSNLYNDSNSYKDTNSHNNISSNLQSKDEQNSANSEVELRKTKSERIKGNTQNLKNENVENLNIRQGKKTKKNYYKTGGDINIENAANSDAVIDQKIAAMERLPLITGKEAENETVNSILKLLFDKLDINADIKTTIDPNNRVIDIDISGDDTGDIIGKKGQTLDAIQYLANIIINKEKGDYYRVKVDTNDYRERRQKTLENLARNTAAKVKKTRRKVVMEPMNPYERRIIHSYLQSDKYVTTKSEGEEPNRRVVVYYKRYN